MAETMAELNKGVSNITSSDEKIVGTYNGKPRYRKEYDFSITNTGGAAVNSYRPVTNQNWNIDKLLVLTGTCVQDNGAWGCGIPYVYGAGTQSVALCISPASGQQVPTDIQMYIYGWGNMKYNFHVIMEYTKS